ncbi:AaceriAER347Wp [[Ashbya] aceris (nom. inval.)]|nr:AaceriAER347Wp [[Ashbya] aceris (nom. inval.)]
MVSVRTAALLTLVVQYAQAVLPIHVKGNRFIRPAQATSEASDNDAFFVIGIDYQPGGSSGYDARSGKDVLSDEAVCARDAAVFQQLGINTIRIYSLNPDVNHDKCMTILNNAGIYVILDVNSGNYGESLNRADPSGSYNEGYLRRVFKFVDAFKNYPNVLGFFAGNEVINDEGDYAETNPQYIRAVQRDIKQYIEHHANRKIPVGYSAAQVLELQKPTLNYLQCNSRDGSTEDEDLEDSRSDFFGLNTYKWCSSRHSWKSSGYAEMNDTYADAVIPLIFSEYGCNEINPRTFEETTDGLYAGLTHSFSGGLIYEYSNEGNNYGLVEIDSGGNIRYRKDFENLKERYQSVKLPSIKEDSLEGKLFQCSADNVDAKDFGTKNFEVPKQPKEIADMIKNGAGGSNTGSILSDYAPPTTFPYTIVDSNNELVSATVTYDPANLENGSGGVVSVAATATHSEPVSSSKNAAPFPNYIAKGGAISVILVSLAALL